MFSITNDNRGYKSDDFSINKTIRIYFAKYKIYAKLYNMF
jgi:hypothetical protein